MSKTKKLTKNDSGRYVRVGFIDTGAMDGIITHVDGPIEFHFLPFRDFKNGSISNNAAPVIALGPHVTAEHSGLIG